MSDWGIKISLPGYDVNTAAPEQLALSSEYISPKLLLNQSPAHANTFSYTLPSSLTPGARINLLSINHGYSYTPASICYYYGQVDASTTDGITPAIIQNAPPIVIYTYCTATQFKIDIVVDAAHTNPISGSGRVFNFRYYILAESGT